jgi:hypothetical protein
MPYTKRSSHMKRTLCSLSIIIALCFAAQAHNHPLFLTQGQSIVGYTFYTTAGQELAKSLSVENGLAQKLVVIAGSSDTTTPWAGDALSFECAIFDGISLGMTTNAGQMMGELLRNGQVLIEGKLSSSFDLGALLLAERSNQRSFSYFLNFETGLDPVYTNTKDAGFGLVSYLATLSLNWRAINTSSVSVLPYLDFKAKFNDANPFYPRSWLSANTYADYPLGHGYAKTSDYSSSIAYASHYFIAAGVDVVAFEKWLLFVGLNVPVASFAKDATDSPRLLTLGSTNLGSIFDLQNWEFELKYKL